jgi:hypothetical protein
VIVVLSAVLALASPPGIVPTPIGAGPRYKLPATRRAVREGRPIGTLRCAAAGARFGVHVELFAYGRVVIVPAGIGVADPAERRLGIVVPQGCTYPARTLAPTGVVEVARGWRLTLHDLFRLWGQRLGPSQLAGFRSTSPLLAFVNGRRWPGDPRAIPLTRHAQIVLELGGYIPPHPSFLFPGDL